MFDHCRSSWVKKPLKLPWKSFVPRFAARLIPRPPVATWTSEPAVEKLISSNESNVK